MPHIRDSLPTITTDATSSTDLPALTVNLGPLPTTFTPPLDCASLTLGNLAHKVQSSAVSTLIEWERGFQCTSAGLAAKSSCYPVRWAPALNNVQSSLGPNAVYPVYSPASICPSGYVTGCVMVYSESGFMQIDTVTPDAPPVTRWSILREGERGIGCCPSGYSCYLPYSCASDPEVGQTITADMVQNCRSKSTERSTTKYVIQESMVPRVVAPQIVLIQSSDATNTTRTSDTTRTADATRTTSTTIPATTSNIPIKDDTSDLSTGTKAAIGIALPLGLIILALMGYIFLYRRRHVAKKQETAEQRSTPGLDKPELDASSPLGIILSPGSELDGTTCVSPGFSAFDSDFGSDGSRLSELPGSLAARVVGGMCELPADEEFAGRRRGEKGILGVCEELKDSQMGGEKGNVEEKGNEKENAKVDIKDNTGQNDTCVGHGSLKGKQADSETDGRGISKDGVSPTDTTGTG